MASCFLVAEAVAADDDRGLIGRSDCRVVNSNPQPNERVEWSGACKDGFAHGSGVLEWYVGGTLSSRYRGTLVNGSGDGVGELDFLLTNNRYEGEFREGRLHGTGQHTLPNGRVIAGRFERGEVVGEVTVTGPGSFRYQGTWRQGQPEGNGHVTYSNGVFYEGGFERGLFEGPGRLVNP